MENKYVLYNPKEANASDYKEEECYGFWSNELGFTVLELATVFTKEEVEQMKIQTGMVGGIVVKLPE